MRSYAGVERATLFNAKKRRERLAHNAATPKCAVDPVTDLAFPVAPETTNVSGDLAIGYDCLFQAGVVGQDFGPMLVELRFVARTEDYQRHGHGISLVFEKD